MDSDGVAHDLAVCTVNGFKDENDPAKAFLESFNQFMEFASESEFLGSEEKAALLKKTSDVEREFYNIHNFIDKACPNQELKWRLKLRFVILLDSLMTVRDVSAHHWSSVLAETSHADLAKAGQTAIAETSEPGDDAIRFAMRQGAKPPLRKARGLGAVATNILATANNWISDRNRVAHERDKSAPPISALTAKGIEGRLSRRPSDFPSVEEFWKKPSSSN